jgi:hypothetical protein
MISRHVVDEVRQLNARQGQLSAADRDRRDPMPRRDDLVAVQAEFEPVHRDLAARAPPPDSGEGLREYRGRLVSALLPYTSTFKSANAFALLERLWKAEIRNEVAANLADRHRGDLDDPRRLRKVEVDDPETGVRRVEWRGNDPRVWMNAFMPPYQLATHIKLFDRRGVEAPPPVKWGSPPRPR